MERVNTQYKDRLFKFIFGREDHKDWTLSLYNAINGSNYQEEKEIQITTIDSVVYLSMKNDVSFLLDTADTMNFYEQQSTYNPNMPVRFLIYAGMVYNGYLERSGYSIYTTKLRELPIPKCVCFYNGKSKKEDEVYLNLSDAYKYKEAESDINVRVRMINVNYGHNKELLDKCRPLGEYSFFVDSIRAFSKKGYTMEEAVSMSIDKLDANSILKPFLLTNREEVCHMILTEYDEEKFAEAMKKEGEEIGEKRGLKQGKAEGKAEERGKIEKHMVKLYKDGIFSEEQAAISLNITVDEFKKLLQKIESVE